MTTEIYDGGPANPIGNESGISIRDYFASAIMTGIYSANLQATISVVDAYRKADEMLDVRSAPLPVVETPAVAIVVPPVIQTPVVEVTDTSTETTTEPTV